MERYKWPKNFPEGIPSKDCIPAAGKVYRLVNKIPPCEKDFMIHREEIPDYQYSQDEIELSYGVSFWKKLNKILRIKKNYPKAEQFGNKLIVSGELVNELGVVPSEPRKDGHVTLWKQINAKPHLYVKHWEDEE
jgi:hypothetical protein